jgi:hypothetical protein
MNSRDDGGVISLGLLPPLAQPMVGGSEQDLVQGHPSWASDCERDHVGDMPGVQDCPAAALLAVCEAEAAVDGLPVKLPATRGRAEGMVR